MDKQIEDLEAKVKALMTTGKELDTKLEKLRPEIPYIDMLVQSYENVCEYLGTEEYLSECNKQLATLEAASTTKPVEAPEGETKAEKYHREGNNFRMDYDKRMKAAEGVMRTRLEQTWAGFGYTSKAAVKNMETAGFSLNEDGIPLEKKIRLENALVKFETLQDTVINTFLLGPEKYAKVMAQRDHIKNTKEAMMAEMKEMKTARQQSAFFQKIQDEAMPMVQKIGSLQTMAEKQEYVENLTEEERIPLTRANLIKQMVQKKQSGGGCCGPTTGLETDLCCKPGPNQ